MERAREAGHDLVRDRVGGLVLRLPGGHRGRRAAGQDRHRRRRPRCAAGPRSPTRGWPTSTTSGCSPRRGGGRWQRPGPGRSGRCGPRPSVKDPAYPDTRYVTDLVAPGVVNTMPEATLRAVADHGEVPADSVRGHYADARQVLDRAGARSASTTTTSSQALERRRRGNVRRQLGAARRPAGRQAAQSVSFSSAKRPDRRAGNDARDSAYVIVGAGLAGAKAAETLREAGLRRPGRADRGRGRTALRAAAAVQGLPAGQGRTRHDLRPPGVVVRRARRRAASRRRR